MDLSLDFGLGVAYQSRSQVAKAVTEGWVRRSLHCVACSDGDLEQTPTNTPACDFTCSRSGCREPYELKASRNAFVHTVLNGSYDSLVQIIDRGAAPNLLLLSYDLNAKEVRDLFVIHRSLLTKAALYRRPPLPPTARRAGWVGANIVLDRLPEGALVPVVMDGQVRDPRQVRADWNRFRFMIGLASAQRGWLADVLSCVHRLPQRTFTLSDIYRFESELGNLHPSNQNVRPKIRQQLQLLVRNEVIRRLTPGLYRLE